MSEKAKSSRRGFLWGAATTTAAATAVVALPKLQPEVAPAVAEPLPAPERGGGYRASPHVEHYYRTTRL